MLFGNDRYCRSFFLTVNCIFDLTAVSRVQPISTPYEANNQIVRFHADSIMDRTASRVISSSQCLRQPDTIRPVMQKALSLKKMGGVGLVSGKLVAKLAANSRAESCPMALEIKSNRSIRSSGSIISSSRICSRRAHIMLTGHVRQYCLLAFNQV